MPANKSKPPPPPPPKRIATYDSEGHYSWRPASRYSMYHGAAPWREGPPWNRRYDPYDHPTTTTTRGGRRHNQSAESLYYDGVDENIDNCARFMQAMLFIVATATTVFCLMAVGSCEFVIYAAAQDRTLPPGVNDTTSSQQQQDAGTALLANFARDMADSHHLASNFTTMAAHFPSSLGLFKFEDPDEPNVCYSYSDPIRDTFSWQIRVARWASSIALCLSGFALFWIAFEFLCCRFPCSRLLVNLSLILAFLALPLSFLMYADGACEPFSGRNALCDLGQGTVWAIVAQCLLALTIIMSCITPKAKPLIRILQDRERQAINDPCCWSRQGRKRRDYPAEYREPYNPRETDVDESLTAVDGDDDDERRGAGCGIICCCCRPNNQITPTDEERPLTQYEIYERNPELLLATLPSEDIPLKFHGEETVFKHYWDDTAGGLTLQSRYQVATQQYLQCEQNYQAMLDHFKHECAEANASQAQAMPIPSPSTSGKSTTARQRSAVTAKKNSDNYEDRPKAVSLNDEATLKKSNLSAITLSSMNGSAATQSTASSLPSNDNNNKRTTSIGSYYNWRQLLSISSDQLDRIQDPELRRLRIVLDTLQRSCQQAKRTMERIETDLEDHVRPRDLKVQMALEEIKRQEEQLQTQQNKAIQGSLESSFTPPTTTIRDVEDPPLVVVPEEEDDDDENLNSTASSTATPLASNHPPQTTSIVSGELDAESNTVDADGFPVSPGSANNDPFATSVATFSSSDDLLHDTGDYDPHQSLLASDDQFSSARFDHSPSGSTNDMASPDDRVAGGKSWVSSAWHSVMDTSNSRKYNTEASI